METIWKYPIPKETPFELSMPLGAVVLCVQIQGEEPFLWVRVDPEAPKSFRRFYIVATGLCLPAHTLYHGTFQTPIDTSGPVASYVFHVFEDIS